MIRDGTALTRDYETLEKAGIFKRKTPPKDYCVRYGLTKRPLFKKLDACKVG